MNENVSIKGNLKRILIVVFFLMLLMLCGSYDNVEASSAMFEVSKYGYSEANNELTVAVKINPNVSLKNFEMQITYDENYLKVMPFVQGNTATGTQDDFRLLEGTTLDGRWSALYGGGEINFRFNEELSEGTTKKDTAQNFCIIKFKVQAGEKVLEENLVTNWFNVNSYAIIDGEDNYYDNDDNAGLVKINPMPQLVSEIIATNIVFDKNEYYDNEQINLVSGTATVKYTNPSGTRIVDLETLTDENGNTINISKGPWTAKYGKNGVKLSYKNVESNEIPVTILDRIEYIKFADYNSIYEYGQELDKENIKVIIKRVSQTKEEQMSLKELEDEGIITIEGFDSTIGPKQTIQQTTKIKDFDFSKYKWKNETKELLLNLTIIDPVEKIEWITEPNKKIYKHKEQLNTAGGKIKVIYKSKQFNEVNITEQMVREKDNSPFDNTIINTRDLKVTYSYTENNLQKNKTLNYEITINDYIKEVTITTPNKINYEYGEELDLNGGKVKVVWSSKEENPEEKNLSEIELINSKTMTGDKLEIIGFDNTKAGKQAITIKYYYVENGERKIKEAIYTINVIDPIIDIKLEDDEKEKITKLYKYEEELKLNNSKLTLVRLSGTEEKIDLTSNMIKNYNSKELGEQILDVEYEGMKIEKAIEVEVEDYIKDIILVKPDKTVYLPGETLDLTGSTVRTITASGILGEEQAVTMEMIFGYKQDEMGTQNLTVTYAGFQKTFEVIFTVQTGTRRYQCLRSINYNTRNFINWNVCYISNCKKRKNKGFKKCNKSLTKFLKGKIRK